jgi:hypothetical protein
MAKLNPDTLLGHVLSYYIPDPIILNPLDQALPITTG